jgi:hypothetical protein
MKGERNSKNDKKIKNKNWIVHEICELNLWGNFDKRENIEIIENLLELVFFEIFTKI